MEVEAPSGRWNGDELSLYRSSSGHVHTCITCHRSRAIGDVQIVYSDERLILIGSEGGRLLLNTQPASGGWCEVDLDGGSVARNGFAAHTWRGTQRETPRVMVGLSGGGGAIVGSLNAQTCKFSVRMRARLRSAVTYGEADGRLLRVCPERAHNKLVPCAT